MKISKKLKTYKNVVIFYSNNHFYHKSFATPTLKFSYGRCHWLFDGVWKTSILVSVDFQSFNRKRIDIYGIYRWWKFDLLAATKSISSHLLLMWCEREFVGWFCHNSRHFLKSVNIYFLLKLAWFFLTNSIKCWK